MQILLSHVRGTQLSALYDVENLNFFNSAV